MIDIDRRLRKARAELAAANELLSARDGASPAEKVMRSEEAISAEARLELLCDLKDETGVGRMPEGDDFERSVVIVVTERLEQGDHGWEAAVRLPGGKLLACSLSDDAPASLGEAVESAGRIITHELAEDRMVGLWMCDARREDVARIREQLEHAIPASLLALFDDLVR
jgi:hypothetical protein